MHSNKEAVQLTGSAPLHVCLFVCLSKMQLFRITAHYRLSLRACHHKTEGCPQLLSALTEKFVRVLVFLGELRADLPPFRPL